MGEACGNLRGCTYSNLFHLWRCSLWHLWGCTYPTNTHQYKLSNRKYYHAWYSIASVVPHLTVAHIFVPRLNNTFFPNTCFFVTRAFHIYSKHGYKETLYTLLSGDNSDTCWTIVSNELGRRANGVNGHVRATDTNNFIRKDKVPEGQKVIYANFSVITDI